MKKIILLIALIGITLSLSAATKKHRNPKQYIIGNELFLYEHGIYLAYPAKLYRITSIHWSLKRGYYTYKSKMKRIPLELMKYHDWNDPQKIGNK